MPAFEPASLGVVTKQGTPSQTLTHPALAGWVPPLPRCGRGLSERATFSPSPALRERVLTPGSQSGGKLVRVPPVPSVRWRDRVPNRQPPPELFAPRSRG